MKNWVSGQPQEGPAPDADNGSGSAVPEAFLVWHQPQPGEPGTQGVSVPAARPRHRSPESGVGNGYHVYPDGPGLCVPGRDHGLVPVNPARYCRGVKHPFYGIQHARAPDQFLCRCSGGSYRGLWCAGDIQHRPGQPVHQ